MQSIYYRLGDTLARMDQWSEAEYFHQAALEAQPDHVATHVSYGTMLARNVSRMISSISFFTPPSGAASHSTLFYTEKADDVLLLFHTENYRVAERLRQNHGLNEPLNWLRQIRVYDTTTVSSKTIER